MEKKYEDAIRQMAAKYAEGCKDKVARRALEMAFIAGGAALLGLLAISFAPKKRKGKAAKDCIICGGNCPIPDCPIQMQPLK